MFPPAAQRVCAISGRLTGGDTCENQERSICSMANAKSIFSRFPRHHLIPAHAAEDRQITAPTAECGFTEVAENACFPKSQPASANQAQPKSGPQTTEHLGRNALTRKIRENCSCCHTSPHGTQTPKGHRLNFSTGFPGHRPISQTKELSSYSGAQVLSSPSELLELLLRRASLFSRFQPVAMPQRHLVLAERRKPNATSF